jgi:hypothetical protein
MTPPEPHIAERISANTIVFADMLRNFQQELLATFDSIRNRDLISLYERIEAIEGSLAALSMTVGELLSTARRLEGDVRALAAGTMVSLTAKRASDMAKEATKRGMAMRMRLTPPAPMAASSLLLAKPPKATNVANMTPTGSTCVAK